ncbi:PREDICTED: putative inactive serine/threonine-protein kinase At5g11400 [Brassica oleracea var. oleracea]|uniref:putative inactive serine/threonine-protein kinase At5g11400 n=1 Tax=Brassica oleracea var. oleracea TaxID=109376 RepID=UPI0006A72C7C|nr:PREDICTED: putative inactive serine/threonine-protein kinase At5g11400 [Brassica oleracea var. oleracea]
MCFNLFKNPIRCVKILNLHQQLENSLKSFKRQPHSVAYKRPISVSENDNLKVFSFTELKKATKNFRECRVVDGDDRSSRKFYKGYIDEYVPSRTVTGITVSVLDVGSSFPLQDREISKEQVQSLGQIIHPNVVKFLGYCCEDDKIHFLVFEYFHKGSLDRHIYGKEEEPLPWEIRVKIAIGVARGVEFIHFIKNKPLFRKLRMYNIMHDSNTMQNCFILNQTKKMHVDSLEDLTTNLLNMYNVVWI